MPFRQRVRIRMQPRQTADPLSAGMLQPFRHLHRIRAGARTQQRLRHFRKRGLGVTKNRHLRRIVLAQFPGVGVEMYGRNPFRHGIDIIRQRQREQIGADRDQQIVLIQQAADRRRQPHQCASV